MKVGKLYQDHIVIEYIVLVLEVKTLTSKLIESRTDIPLYELVLLHKNEIFSSSGWTESGFNFSFDEIKE